MSAGSKSRAQALDEFLLSYLPYGISDDAHDLVAAMIEAARRHLAAELRARDDLEPEDDDDQPMRD